MAKPKLIRAEATVPEDKIAAAVAAQDALNKRYGAGSLMKMGDRVGIPYPSTPTGIYQLDNEAIAIGGFPRGRIVELYGPESSGKTSLLLCAIAEAQRVGGLCALVDVEHAFDPTWGAKMGVDVDSLFVSQPSSGEEALETAETLVRSGAFTIIGVDSVAALVPQAELNGEMGDSMVGVQARLMSQACRKLTGAVSATHTTLVFINQIREKIGVMFGSPETTAGGRALKFYASLRIDIRRIATIKDGERAIGNRVKFKIVKNKMAAPFKEVEADIMFDSGFSKQGSVLDAAVANGVVSKAGAWFKYGEHKYQGRDSFIASLKEEPDLFDELYAEVRAKDTGVA